MKQIPENLFDKMIIIGTDDVNIFVLTFLCHFLVKGKGQEKKGVVRIILLDLQFQVISFCELTS